VNSYLRNMIAPVAFGSLLGGLATSSVFVGVVSFPIALLIISSIGYYEGVKNSGW